MKTATSAKSECPGIELIWAHFVLNSSTHQKNVMAKIGFSCFQRRTVVHECYCPCFVTAFRVLHKISSQHLWIQSPCAAHSCVTFPPGVSAVPWGIFFFTAEPFRFGRVLAEAPHRLHGKHVSGEHVTCCRSSSLSLPSLSLAPLHRSHREPIELPSLELPTITATQPHPSPPSLPWEEHCGHWEARSLCRA